MKLVSQKRFLNKDSMQYMHPISYIELVHSEQKEVICDMLTVRATLSAIL